MSDSTPRRGCVFCGRIGKLTKEHLFRKSLAGRIPASPDLTLLRVDVDGTTQRTDMPISMFEKQVREVCSECNSGWMNGIDIAIEDLLVEIANMRTFEIPASSVANLARLATRIALLRTLDERARNGHANGSLFRFFYEHQLPPPGTVIRVGLLTEAALEGGSNGHARLAPLDEDSAVTDLDNASSLNIVTWGIGALYVHVILSSEGVSRIKARDLDRANRTLGKMLPLLWPGRRKTIRLTVPIEPDILHVIGSARVLIQGVEPVPFRDLFEDDRQRDDTLI